MLDTDPYPDPDSMNPDPQQRLFPNTFFQGRADIPPEQQHHHHAAAGFYWSAAGGRDGNRRQTQTTSQGITTNSIKKTLAQFS
jgi:hypothetical protein